MKKKQMIVTGAFGFLGRHVAKVFSMNGFIVSGFGHGNWSPSEWKKWGLSEWRSCDINLDTLQTYAKKPDVIVHCAGSGSVEYSLAHPMQDFERTVLSTVSILEYLRLYSPGTLLIYPSSAAVYGSVDRLPISESAPLNPVSPYGVHKKIVEEICQSFASQFSIPIILIRFFSLYGPHLRKQLLWDACTKIENNDFNFYGTGKEIRDWLHVTDAVKLILSLTSQISPSTRIINGGTGFGTPVSEIIDLIIEEMKKPNTPSFSQHSKNGDPVGYVADIGLAKELGWRTEVLLNEGIEEYVRWYKSGAQ